MTTLFISDLHLTPSRPDITDCFFSFLHNEAINADALYILGDLFEFWVGDDDNNAFNQQIKAALKQLTGSGVPCFFVQGNRDFLVGRRFEKETGVKLLPDVCKIDLYGRQAIILHGDTLCTDDHKYQAYRKKVHLPWLQFLYNRLPLSIKLKIVSRVQNDIAEEKKSKNLDIMDVNQSEVVDEMNRYSVDLMIHGHTHRPDIHHFESGTGDKTRIVLGDWYQQGSVLVFSQSSFQLETRDFNR
ncbi:UDP-2,3-diacylglucosamine diphosphatase [Vibrio sp. SCSIO 43137]|uniref:UDP-2,3-diacylglucosamine diphosphatase n=1 Tax=Vibrio sp. SCSIO 43137 TaxID=3021011 RepID=UPI002307F916|nr:UDP-2,3-diacylglucosamine diphosphatase [Vibrio sp. SCSIO 43137]WCE30707.1 UDP-2,3-diacylglucosamine diphosphatase [Vibrio sp. SCSIO 43137]